MILSIKDQFLQGIRKEFSPDIEIEKRVKVISDLEFFRYGEDESVWEQERGKRAKVYQIYFDDEFICTFKEDDIHQAVFLMFWRGLMDKYKRGMIRFDPLWKKKNDELLEEETKKIEKNQEVEKKKKRRKSVQSKEEHLAVQVVEKLEGNDKNSDNE